MTDIWTHRFPRHKGHQKPVEGTAILADTCLLRGPRVEPCYRLDGCDRTHMSWWRTTKPPGCR